ncbi:MAG: DUF2807 domain-containing protein [Bacteroidales bacterium]|nr:DUF2807 domain-containing protein [Bacteroidales bacterium]
MRRIIWIFVILMAFTACRDKELDMTVLNKSLFAGTDFTEINISDAWEVNIIQDDQNPGVELEYSAFLEDYLNVKLTGNVLNIGFNQNLNLPYNTVNKAVIHTKTMDKLIVNEAAKVVLNGDFSGEALEIQLDGTSVCRGGSFTGNADIHLEDVSQVVDFVINGSHCDLEIKENATFKGNLTADSVTVVMNDGARMITYGGQAQCIRLTLSETSMLNTLNTPVDEALVEVTNESQATLHVNTLLKGTLEGASLLYYKGHPTVEMQCDSTSMFIPL